jgi:hypothetical protein
MWSSAQALVTYGETVGTMIVAGALADWSLGDAQRRWLGERAAEARAFVAAVRRRRLLDLLCRQRVQRGLLAVAFLCDLALDWQLTRRIDYRGTLATGHDILLGKLLLFVVPLAVAALVLVRAGPRFVALLVGRGNLPVCWAKCAAVALAAGLLGYGSVALIDATLRTFGPRAVLDWWDARLWIFAAEHALSGVIASALTIAGLLVVLLGAAGLALLLVGLAIGQIGLLARIIARYPRGALLGSSIAVAGLAVVIKDWM